MLINSSILQIIILVLAVNLVATTVDINLSEFEYLANHLHNDECRKLVSALHFQNFEWPNAVDQAERRVPKDEPCLKLLLHWNSQKGEGKSETHEFVARRLRQMNRDDLGIWLTKTSYDAISHDFDRVMNESFRSNQINASTPKPPPPPEIIKSTLKKGQTVVPLDRFSNRQIAKQDFIPTLATDIASDPTEWTVFDTISWTLVILLFLIILVLLIYLMLASPCCRRKRKRCKRCECAHPNDYCPTPPPYSKSPPCARSTCPAGKSRSKQFRQIHVVDSDGSSEEYEVREQNKAALDLMGVELPTQSTYTKRTCSQCDLHRDTRKCGCPSSCGSRTPCQKTFCDCAICAPPPRTIDIHQKIAIPMSPTCT